MLNTPPTTRQMLLKLIQTFKARFSYLSELLVYQGRMVVDQYWVEQAEVWFGQAKATTTTTSNRSPCALLHVKNTKVSRSLNTLLNTHQLERKWIATVRLKLWQTLLVKFPPHIATTLVCPHCAPFDQRKTGTSFHVRFALKLTSISFSHSNNQFIKGIIIYIYHANAPIGSHSSSIFGFCSSTFLTVELTTLGSTTAWYTNSSIQASLMTK